MISGQLPKMIGISIKRKEDPRLITGDGKYTDDVHLRGMTYMAVLRSSHGHARIRLIDTSIALQQPEVLAVLTGQDVNQHCKAQFPVADEDEGTKPKSRWPMPTEVVKYVGESIAVVVATSTTAARDALDLIDVAYEPLPVVVDMEKAIDPGSPLVHEDLGTNLCVESSGRAGDPDRAFGEADGVVSARLTEPRLVPSPMEPRAVVASYERSTGNMILWLSTQAPHMERSCTAEILGIPENKLRVIAGDVGGGFGCKIETYPETIIAAILSMHLARPVKWVEDRQEHFISTIHGRGEVQYVEAAYQKDGTLLVLQRQFREGCGVMPAWRRGAWHGSVWPVRYCPAYPQATAATRLARTVPGAAFPAPPGRPAAS